MAENGSGKNGPLYQVSLLQALSLGDYTGSVTLAELKRHGDMAIGTFDGLDGEMIMVDGTVYRADSNCSISIMDDGTTVPFACTMFGSDSDPGKASAGSFGEFSERMACVLDEKGPNAPYFIRIEGLFERITVRSIGKQDPPYRKLAEVMLGQTVRTFEGMCGTAVGLYCPSYMGAMNYHGWHLHFVSEDRKVGGHVLDLGFSDLPYRLTRAGSVEVALPETCRFQTLDLEEDQGSDIRRIEGN